MSMILVSQLAAHRSDQPRASSRRRVEVLVIRIHIGDGGFGVPRARHRRGRSARLHRLPQRRSQSRKPRVATLPGRPTPPSPPRTLSLTRKASRLERVALRLDLAMEVEFKQLALDAKGGREIRIVCRASRESDRASDQRQARSACGQRCAVHRGHLDSATTRIRLRRYGGLSSIVTMRW